MKSHLRQHLHELSLNPESGIIRLILSIRLTDEENEVLRRESARSPREENKERSAQSVLESMNMYWAPITKPQPAHKHAL